jgi:hypothetical protein
MRLAVGMILVLATAACDRPVARTGVVRFELNPNRKRISTKLVGFSSPDGPQAGMGVRSGGGGKGEWQSAFAVWASGTPDNPFIVLRCFDHENGAVRVELTFKDSEVPGLGSVVFDHVTRAENLTFDSKPYTDTAHKGETLEVRVPPANGTLSFLAWAHVH